MAGFTDAQWQQAHDLLTAQPADFGFPVRRDASVLIGTFNILKLGNAADNQKRWDFLVRVAEQYDLLALQEVTDTLDGLRRVLAQLPNEYEVVVSDTTSASPDDAGFRERLAFVFRSDRLRLDEVVSDLTYDRSYVVRKMFENRALWDAFFDQYQQRVFEAAQAGDAHPSLSGLAHPAFSVFIRPPHCAAFSLLGRNNHADVGFLAVNAHVLFRNAQSERSREFHALIEWLVQRTTTRGRACHGNLVLMGDLNFDFSGTPQELVDRQLRALNSNMLMPSKAGCVNFPLLTPHPTSDGQLYRTNVRDTETYDHVAFFIDQEENRLPDVPMNRRAGQGGPNAYDYGIFRFQELLSQVVHDTEFAHLREPERSDLLQRCNDDVSDHAPVWVRLPIPGA